MKMKMKKGSELLKYISQTYERYGTKIICKKIQKSNILDVKSESIQEYEMADFANILSEKVSKSEMYSDSDLDGWDILHDILCGEFSHISNIEEDGTFITYEFEVLNPTIILNRAIELLTNERGYINSAILSDLFNNYEERSDFYKIVKAPEGDRYLGKGFSCLRYLGKWGPVLKGFKWEIQEVDEEYKNEALSETGKQLRVFNDDIEYIILSLDLVSQDFIKEQFEFLTS